MVTLRVMAVSGRENEEQVVQVVQVTGPVRWEVEPQLPQGWEAKASLESSGSAVALEGASGASRIDSSHPSFQCTVLYAWALHVDTSST